MKGRMMPKGYAVFLISLMGAVVACPTAPAFSQSAALRAVIEGAKKEGTVAANLVRTIDPASIPALQAGIKTKFGVDLKINYTPIMTQSTAYSKAALETKSGSVPTYDLYGWGTPYIIPAMKDGVAEKADWKPLLTPDMNPKVVQTIPEAIGGIIYYSSALGVLYDKKKITGADIPTKLSGLANPKWKGRIGLSNTLGHYECWGFTQGADKTIADVTAILKNGAIQAAYTDLLNSLMLGDIYMAVNSSAYLTLARSKNYDAGWAYVDFAPITGFGLNVTKGAAHPNAAKLLSIYLASPDGSKYLAQYGQCSSYYYPGNDEYDLYQQALSQKLTIFETHNKSDLIAWEATPAYVDYNKALTQLFQSGGK